MILEEDERRLLDVLGNASSLQLYRLQALVGRMLTDPARIIEGRRHLHLGAAVRYLDTGSGTMRPARVIELKDRDLVVRDDATHRMWRLPYAAIESPPPGAPPGRAAPPPPPSPPRATRDDFQRGQKVSFEDRHLRTQVGVITRMNPQTATIDTGDGMSWKVSYALLRHVMDV